MTTVTQARVESSRVAAAWLESLAAVIGDADSASTTGPLLLEDGYWRDAASLTRDLRTFRAADGAEDELLERARAAGLSGIRLEPGARRQERPRWGDTIEARFAYETVGATGRGLLRMRRDGDDRWRAWTLYTELDSLTGRPEHTGAERPRGHSGARAPERGEQGEPEVVIVGAGHAGLALAARLGALDVSTLVVEAHDRIGDNWRHRYQSLVLHNQIWANHLPYLPFPSTWPVYLDKDQLADWLELYARALAIDVRVGVAAVAATYDEQAGRWRLVLSDGAQLRPRHIVMATGVLGAPREIALPGAESFEGPILHAARYRGGFGSGTRVLVIGGGSSAHDVAQDLHGAGAEVVMLQRGSTCVVSLEPGAVRAYSIYRENGQSLEDADLVTNSFPFALVTELHKDMTAEIAELDRELLSGLSERGFALDFGEDGSGFLMKHQRHGGGYYINVGASDLIVSGEVGVRSGVEIANLDGSRVTLSDGTDLEIDAIIAATGYHNLSQTIAGIFGAGTADAVGPVWGLDHEGELNAMWRPTGQKGLWVMGGSLQQARSYSRVLALQIAAHLDASIETKG